MFKSDPYKHSTSALNPAQADAYSDRSLKMVEAEEEEEEELILRACSDNGNPNSFSMDSQTITTDVNNFNFTNQINDVSASDLLEFLINYSFVVVVLC